MSRKIRRLGWTLGGVAALCMLACATSPRVRELDVVMPESGADLPRPCNAPNCVPPLPAVTVDDDALDENLLRDKVVILFHWSTYCESCLDLFPRLQQMNARYHGRPVVLVGILQDTQANDGQALAARQRSDVEFPQVRVTPRLIRAAGAQGVLPLLVVYGRDGQLVQRWEGNVDVGAVESLVDGLLAPR